MLPIPNSDSNGRRGVDGTFGDVTADDDCDGVDNTVAAAGLGTGMGVGAGARVIDR